MTIIKKKKKYLSLLLINSFMVFLLIPKITFAQDSPYQAIRLNNGNPIIEPSMFVNQDDGLNINGPSLIRVPDWIPVNNRANPSAKYYLYFAHHVGDYIRMAWAENIEGPYTLYDDSVIPGDRGVLDNNETDIFLNNDIRIEENHLASPDVIVDDENQRIIMYFHSGSSYFVGDEEQNSQVTWVSTSPYGLEFYEGIESVQLGSSYFRVFEYDDDLYALDNGSRINRALDPENPWEIPTGHDFTKRLWDRNPNHVFQDAIPVPSSELRVRHTGVRVVGDQLHVFYSRRGELQERIQLSTVNMTSDWEQWEPTYPPIEILTPNPGWEGGERELEISKTSAGVDVNQLRDPDVFEDTDGELYVIYTGNGEGGIGIAKLYETPTITTTLTAIEDAHIKESSLNNNFGGLTKLRTSTGTSSSDKRTIYMKFDLSEITDVDHATVRLYLGKTTGGPVTIYETSNDWLENSITAGNSPSLGEVITTTYLTNEEQYYDWNISTYAKANAGSILSVAFDIATSSDASHEFGSLQSSNPAQLLLTAPENLLTTTLLSEFDANAGSQTIEVSANIDWTISENTSWFTVNRTSGSNNGSISVMVDENETVNDRNATVTITGAGISRVITISQSGAKEEAPMVFIPDPTKLYYIDSPVHNLRLAATGGSEDAYTTGISTTGNDVEWVFVDKGNGYWHLQRGAGGSKPRLRTDNSSNADMQATSSSGTFTYYEMTQGALNGTYFFTLPNGPTYKRLQVNSQGDVKMVTTASDGTWESFSITEVGEIIANKNAVAKEVNVLEITAFPNPFLETITIHNPNQETGNVELIDFSGRRIIHKPITPNKTILNNLGKLSNGVYLIRVLDAKEEVVKIIKTVK